MTFPVTTTIAANDNVDTWLPSAGRTTTDMSSYLAHNAVFNVMDYGAVGDGTTLDATYIQNALNAAQTAGGGVVLIPYTPNGYNIGSNSPGLTVYSNTHVVCPNGYALLKYAGTGTTIDTTGGAYIWLQNLYVQCSNDAANGIQFGGSATSPSRWCRMDNVTVQASGNSTATGSGFILNSGAQWCANLHGRQCYSLQFKYGLNVIGQSVGSHTWTNVVFDMLTLVGRSTGIIAGSIGIQTDTNSNLEASFLRGLLVEAFAQMHSFASGTDCFGFSCEGGIEGNTTNFPRPPIGYAGDIRDFHADYQYRQTCNGTSNRWMQELIQTGVWTTESRYHRIHCLYEGSSTQVLWGVQRGGSLINGEQVRDKFVVSTGGQGDVGSTLNWLKFLEYKLAFDTANPTGSSWGGGSLLFDKTPASGRIAISQCTSAGTNKSAPTSNATTTNGSATVTVDSISTLAVGDYITVAGAFPNPTEILYISGTTLTMASTASGSVSSVAVAYATPSWRSLIWAPGMDADLGNTSVTLTSTSAPTQRFLTNLTANRTITLPTPTINQKFRIFRQGLGAFTLTVLDNLGATLKVMPSATAAWCDVEADYTSKWYLTAYGAL